MKIGDVGLGLQKSAVAFEGRQGPEGAVGPHLDGCGKRHICTIFLYEFTYFCFHFKCFPLKFENITAFMTYFMYFGEWNSRNSYCLMMALQKKTKIRKYVTLNNVR